MLEGLFDKRIVADNLADDADNRRIAAAGDTVDEGAGEIDDGRVEVQALGIEDALDVGDVQAVDDSLVPNGVDLDLPVVERVGLGVEELADILHDLGQKQLPVEGQRIVAGFHYQVKDGNEPNA